MKRQAMVNGVREKIADAADPIRRLGSVMDAVNQAGYLDHDLTYAQRSTLADLLAVVGELAETANHLVNEAEVAANDLSLRLKPEDGVASGPKALAAQDTHQRFLAAFKEVGYEPGADWGGLIYALMHDHGLTASGAKQLLEHLRNLRHPHLRNKAARLTLVDS